MLRMEYKHYFACRDGQLTFISVWDNYWVSNVNWTFILCSNGFILLNDIKTFILFYPESQTSYKRKEKKKRKAKAVLEYVEALFWF